MRTAAIVALLGTATALAGAAGPTLSRTGVGGLVLGRPLAAIRHDRLIGPTTPGCELASPRPIAARLRAPLTGFATFAGSGSHRLQALAITGGVKTSRGVAIGDTAGTVLKAYPAGKANDSRPADPLQFHAIVVRSGGRDVIWFMLDRSGGKVTELDVPGPQFCE